MSFLQMAVYRGRLTSRGELVFRNKVAELRVGDTLAPSRRVLGFALTSSNEILVSGLVDEGPVVAALVLDAASGDVVLERRAGCPSDMVLELSGRRRLGRVPQGGIIRVKDTAFKVETRYVLGADESYKRSRKRTRALETGDDRAFASYLDCHMCMQRAVRPSISRCGHMACRACWARLCAEQFIPAKCRVCQQPVMDDEFIECVSSRQIGAELDRSTSGPGTAQGEFIKKRRILRAS